MKSVKKERAQGKIHFSKEQQEERETFYLIHDLFYQATNKIQTKNCDKSLYQQHKFRILHIVCVFFTFQNYQMRHEMVLQKEGEMEFSLLTHTDDMKRVSTRTQRFVDIQTHRKKNQLHDMSYAT